MANIEADRRKQRQPPVHRPPPRVPSPPPADINHPTSGTLPSSTPSVTVTMVTRVEQHAPAREASRSSSYTDAVKGGKRPASSQPAPDIEISGATQPKQDMRSRNMNLLDPNYDPSGGQLQPPDSLQTPRPPYSPITPTEVERYLHERSPGTPYFQGYNSAENQQPASTQLIICQGLLRGHSKHPTARRHWSAPGTCYDNKQFNFISIRLLTPTSVM